MVVGVDDATPTTACSHLTALVLRLELVLDVVRVERVGEEEDVVVVVRGFVVIAAILLVVGL